MAKIFKAIDIQTGKEEYINFKDDIFSHNKNIIETIYNNKYYKIIEKVTNCNKETLCLSKDDWKYTFKLDIIKVHFNPNDKGYAYFIDKELKAQIEDVISRRTISIKTPYGDKEIYTIESVTETDWQNATKLLKLSDEEVEKRILIKYWDRQRGVLGSPTYQYSIDKEEDIKEKTFYTILPNNLLVYVEQITEVLKRKPILLRKKLINPKEQINNLSQEERKLFINYCDSYRIKLPSNLVLFSTQQNFEQESIDLNKGEDNMNTNKIFKNLEFGKINTDAIKMSVNGLAFKQEDGTYVTYDALKNEFTDVTPFILDFNLLCAMPVAIGNIAENDIIKHNGKYVIVKEILEDNTISAINPITGEEIVIIPTKNIFGFNYYTKIMNVFAGFGTDAKPNEDNPFGNMLPFLFMNENKGDMSDFLLMSMMTNQKGMMANPMMMLAFMNKN